MPNVLPFATHVRLVESLLNGASPRGAAKEIKIDKDIVYRMLRKIGLGCENLIAYAKTGNWHDTHVHGNYTDALVMMAAIHCAWALYVRGPEPTAAMAYGASVSPLTIAQLVLLALSSVDAIRPTHTKRNRRYIRKTHGEDADIDADIFGTRGKIIGGTSVHTPIPTAPAAKVAVAEAVPPDMSYEHRAASDILMQRKKSVRTLPPHIRELLDD